ncbi:MAG: LytTR family DNA-binding domain-containing protein [Muribaculaceae bacterium]|nr:LytTR family DNA-binding domain-containing protein [Muribaculaceae bacterium]
MNCCVIDDEPLAAGLIASYIEKHPLLMLGGVFHSAQEAVREVMGGKFDMVFLDIKMPQLNGVEFARLVPRSTRVIFTTAYDSHAIEAFRVGAADYLLKPVSYEDFNAAVARVHERMPVAMTSQPELAEHILVKHNHKFEQIATAGIVCLEGLKDYVKVHLDDGRMLVTLCSMRSFESLLSSRKFMRVHRSYIVNTDAIQSIERNRLTLVGGHEVPVSDGYRQAVADYIAAHNPMAGGY